MKCNKCNTDNRNEAIYCKHCGEKLAQVSVDPFQKLIGIEWVKKQLKEYIDTALAIKARSASITTPCNTIIMGASGTGKSHIANSIAKTLYANGLVKKPKPEVVDAVDWDDFMQDWQNNIKQLDGGVLIVDNVQKLVREDDTTDVGRLDKLFSEMERWGGNPVVILTGLPGGFREFLDKSPEVRNRFRFMFRLEEYSAKELTAIVVQRIMMHYHTQIEQDAFSKIERVMMHLVRNKPDNWGNAHSARALADEIYTNMVRRGGDRVECDDIKGKEHHEKTAEEILAQFDELVGIDNIRDEFRRLIRRIEDDREQGKAVTIDQHFIFTGNPGTGKTTVARMMGDIFKAMGVLPSGHVVECDRDKLVAGYVGQTARQTNEAIDSAMGGVLFIDEAYTLTQDSKSGGSFGKESVDTLLKRLEDDRGKFVCIAAGYPKEMFDFIQSNPGLPSRFDTEIKFNDYNGKEMAEIFRRFAKKDGYVLDDAAERNIVNFFDSIPRNKDFANARTARQAFKEARTRYADRKDRLRGQGLWTPEMDFLLTRDDIEGEESQRQLNIEDVLAEMDRDFVGMTEVKELLRSIGRKIERNRQRMERGLIKPQPISLNILLTGNPGTGKTTVARTLSKILRALKVLSKDTLIEVDKSKMVVPIVGDTAPNVNKLVDRALGGILFIDEAYTLSSSSGMSADYGKEAIEALMKRMEDDRGKFVCIMAGYKEPMEQFVQINPGIDSRITHRIHIPDYTADELVEIFALTASKSGFKLTLDAADAVTDTIDMLVANKDENFGNAREMRKLLDATIARQEERLDTIDDYISDEQLMSIEQEDIPTYQEYIKLKL